MAGTRALALFRCHRPQRGEQRRDAAFLAEGLNAHGVERGFDTSSGNGGRKLGAEGADLGLEGHGGLGRKDGRR